MIVTTVLLSLLLVLCVGLSALFSSSETGFLSINRIRLRHLSKNGDGSARYIERMLRKPDEFFSFILLGNNLVLVMASAIATYLAILYLGPDGPAIASIILTVVVLIFGEVIPKTLFRQFADILSYRIVPLLSFFRKLLHPLVVVFLAVLHRILKDQKKRSKSPFVTREEMHLLVKEGERTGALEAHERDMIHSIFSFSKTKVEDVMIPLTDVVVIDVDASERELYDISRKHNYTRVPVFDDRVDNISGIVNIYEVLYSKKKKWQDVIRPVLFVPHTKQVGALIKELQVRHERMAVVINEYGSSIGIATMEDLMEEVVGEIHDEEEEMSSITSLGNKMYAVSGKCDLLKFNEVTGLSLEKNSFDTISGYVFSTLGRVPKVGERINGGSFVLTVKRMERNRILLVHVRVK